MILELFQLPLAQWTLTDLITIILAVVGGLFVALFAVFCVIGLFNQSAD